MALLTTGILLILTEYEQYQKQPKTNLDLVGNELSWNSHVEW